VSNLFARDETDEMLQELVPIMKKELARRPPTIENLQDYLMSRTRKNLHVVLCFSPVSAVYTLVPGDLKLGKLAGKFHPVAACREDSMCHDEFTENR